MEHLSGLTSLRHAKESLRNLRGNLGSLMPERERWQKTCTVKLRGTDLDPTLVRGGDDNRIRRLRELTLTGPPS